MVDEPVHDAVAEERPSSFFEAVRRATGDELQRRLLAPGLTRSANKLPSEVQQDVARWVKRLRPGKSVLGADAR